MRARLAVSGLCAAGLLVIGGAAAGCHTESKPPATNPNEGTLPAGYPSSDVPIANGTILPGATSTEEQGTRVWLVSVQGTGTDIMGNAVKKLTDAGLTIDDKAGVAPNAIFYLSGKGYHVTLSASQGAAALPNVLYYSVSRS